VDQDSLWRFDVSRSRIDQIPLGTGAQWTSLHYSGSDRFSAGHHFDFSKFEISVRPFADPGQIIARAAVSQAGNEVIGDASAWEGVPHLYFEYLKFAGWNDYVLIQLIPSERRIQLQSFEWYDSRYDKGYQGIVDVLELPGKDLALVSVSRSSRVVLHDLKTGGEKGFVDLANRMGNPKLMPRHERNEIWTTDYDTVVVVDSDSMRVRKSRRLQSAFRGSQQFVGDLAFAPDANICAVARPFNGDVVGIDGASLRIKYSAKLERQPLSVAALHDGEIVARDWKTGELLRGRLERRLFWGR